MSEPIKVGDLVQIARPRMCGCLGRLGMIFQVTEFTTDASILQCVDCGALNGPPFTPTVRSPSGQHIEVRRLKRIPPLSELEGVEHKQELPA